MDVFFGIALVCMLVYAKNISSQTYKRLVIVVSLEQETWEIAG